MRPVSHDLEIAEITDRVSKGPAEHNKALLFTNVQGFDVPVLINAFGSAKRMNMSLEVENLDDIAERIRFLIKPKVPEKFLDKLAMLPTLMEVAKFPPKLITGAAPCQEVVLTDPTQPMLDKLPIIKCWPEDGGDFVTMGVVITRDPKNGIRNLGMYRLQKYDNVTTGMHWHKHHDGAKAFEEKRRESVEAENNSATKQKRKGAIAPENAEPPNYGTIFEAQNKEANPARRLEVAIALGCDPSITYAATAPLPPDIDEFLLAGFLRQSPVRLVKCKTIDLEVPANAEIIIEGYVNQDELQLEGPFGDHTGFYSPRWHVSCTACDRCHTPTQSDLSDHYRRQTTARRLLFGKSNRTYFFTDAADACTGNSRHESSLGRCFP